MNARLVTAFALATAGAAAAALVAARAPSATLAEPSRPETAAVQRRDLAERIALDGTLGYRDERPVVALRPGVVTFLAREGRRLDRGGILYALDGRPVRVLAGRVPAWRALGPGDRGPDVRQLERNLRALGHAPGTADETFDAATERAVRAWQHDTGQPPTGRLGAGDVVFLPGLRRIGTHEVALGMPVAAGSAVMTTTTRAREVSLALDVRRRSEVRRGARAIVELPSGERIRARISRIGAVARTSEADGSATVAVRIALPARRVARLDAAPVLVRVTTAVARGVLAVPVSALLARATGGAAIEVLEGAGTRLVPVRTGAFADGWVQVGGDGVREGMRVVIAA